MSPAAHVGPDPVTQNTCRERLTIPAIRAKSLSKVKSVALCSEAIAAISASVVVTATPFGRAARKMLAASRYVANPFRSVPTWITLALPTIRELAI